MTEYLTNILLILLLLMIQLKLKIGAQVLLLRNMHESNLVNGSRGVVLSLHGHDGAVPDESTAAAEADGSFVRVVVKWDNGSIVTIVPVAHSISKGATSKMTRKQLPLRLAWALTVHKAQGMTLSRAQLSLGNSFEYGQGQLDFHVIDDGLLTYY